MDSMDKEFWLKRWEDNKIGFHKSSPNPLLIKYFNNLALEKNSRLFIPLCGKTRDIEWLLSEGYRVVGVELSELAIEQLFAELNVIPDILSIGKIKHYCAEGIDIFVGDIFKITSQILNSVDAIFDRAALVALPEKIRVRYIEQLMNIAGGVPQLIISHEYNQQMMDGPPFSISDEDINSYYKDSHRISLLASEDVTGKMREGLEMKENVWLLQPL